MVAELRRVAILICFKLMEVNLYMDFDVPIGVCKHIHTISLF